MQKPRQNGSAAVECMLVMPLFCLMLMAILGFSLRCIGLQDALYGSYLKERRTHVVRAWSDSEDNAICMRGETC